MKCVLLSSENYKKLFKKQQWLKEDSCKIIYSTLSKIPLKAFITVIQISIVKCETILNTTFKLSKTFFLLYLIVFVQT